MEELKVHSSRREHHRNSSKLRTNDDSLVSEIVEIRARDGNGVGVNVNQQSENALNENRLLRNVDANVGNSVVPDVSNEPSTLADSTSVEKIHTGIIGYVDRDIQRGHRKPMSDPTASPAQRSTRSRSSVEKSPRSKRSKSESRRRRERKMIAAGELEVRQANETLMRYLRQCNDASLSGEMEIDKNIEDRRVHRKTRSQRERRNMQVGKLNGSRERMSANGLTSILSDLVDDIIPGNGEIYNPFTPVISPTEGPPARIEKMFVQTSRNSYRSVDHDLYMKHSGHDIEGNVPSNFSNSGIYMSCTIQRIWILLTNICHGLLGGLALSHIIFISSTKPNDLIQGSTKHYSTFAEMYANTFYCLAIVCMVSIFDRMDLCRMSLSNAAESISFKWIIIVMIYLATIILSLSAESLDERLYVTSMNVTVWEDEIENNRVLNIWNSMSIARSMGAISGWILIGLSSENDLLFDHLVEMHQYQLNNN
ncbi:hypothetical protein HA402_007841 [Bradysia odoriphaga]|nr:hypothetical protein HA402_007841 [Bradysia odoriphaga]